MNNGEIVASIIAAISALIAAVSAWIAWRALTDNRRLVSANERLVTANEQLVELTNQSVAANVQLVEVTKQAAAGSQRIAVQALKQNEQVFKRQHVLDLHMAWHGFRRLDPARFDDPAYIVDIVNAANLLGLTATLWNHDVVEKAIIEQQYWTEFDNAYQALASRTTTIQKVGKSGRDFLTDDIQLAHEKMQQFHEQARQQRLAAVQTSKVGS
jgi:hypothetical protein